METNNNSTNNRSPILLIILGVVILVWAYFYYSNNNQHTETTYVADEAVDCDIITKKIVQDKDDSEMGAHIKPGEEVEVEMGYYGCNDPKDNDIVLVQTSGRIEPIIRIVKVVPEDKFAVEKSKDKFNLTVNGSEMENLDGEPYQFHEAKSMMLRLYEKSLQSKMIANTYFIFSNDIAGGYDSTRFGPVEKAKILGRVVMHK